MGKNPIPTSIHIVPICYTRAEKVDFVFLTCRALNECCRIITECLRPTEVHKLHTVSGIATPQMYAGQRYLKSKDTNVIKIQGIHYIRIRSCGKAPRIEIKFHAPYKKRLPDYKTRKTEYVERKKHCELTNQYGHER